MNDSSTRRLLRSSRGPRPRRLHATRWALLLVLVAAGFAGTGCLHDPSIGPLFMEEGEPAPGRARVYLYRVDPQHSFSLVELRFDGNEPLHLLDEEYTVVELAEGTHALDFRLRRRLLWPSGAWSAQRIRARAGETYYFEIAVGVIERPLRPGRDSEIAGRSPSGTAGESVSIRMKSAREAMERLRQTHLHVP